LEELVAEQDNANAALSEKLRRYQQEMASVRSEMERQSAVTNQERATAEAALKDEVKSVLEEKEQLERKLQEQSDELVILRGELSAAQEAAQQAPSRTVRTLVEQLRNQLTLKEKQNKSLSQALLQLRADLVATAQQSAESKARDALEAVNVQQLIDAQTSELQGRIHELQAKLDRLRTELKQKKDKDISMTSRIEDLTEQINRKDDAIEQLTLEVSQLQKVNNQLHSKELGLMKEQAQQRRNHGVASETEDLRRQIRSLQSKLDQQEKQMKQQKQTVLQPVTSSGLPSRASSVKSQEEVIRWDESKKWQKKVETLKSKLADKTKECETFIKQVTSLKETVTRLERERSVLQSRMKTDSDHVAKVLEKPSTRTEELKTEIFQLKEQVSSLQHQLKTGPQADMLHLQTTNQELVNTIHTLECQLKDVSTGSEFDALRHRQRELEDKVLMLEKDNVQLQLELESANSAVPRLQSRVDDLQQYVNVLSSESSSSHQPSSGRDRVIELERVVAAMKRVVEKLQSENESLKRSRPSSNSLAAENRRLKQELESIKTETVVGSGNTRPLASSKLIAANDRLRRELKQEVERAERLDVSRAKLELSYKQLQKELQEVREEESSAEKGASSKMVEKMRTLQSELDRKNGMLQEVKKHVRSAAEREKEWQKKQAELEEQVSLLQRVSEGSLSLKQLSDQLTSSRQQVERYEEERVQLLEENARLKQQDKQQVCAKKKSVFS
jgi:centrosomal protein CEP290